MRFIPVLYYNCPSVSLFDISSLGWAFRAQLFGIVRVWSKTQLKRMGVWVSLKNFLQDGCSISYISNQPPSCIMSTTHYNID